MYFNALIVIIQLISLHTKYTTGKTELFTWRVKCLLFHYKLATLPNSLPHIGVDKAFHWINYMLCKNTRQKCINLSNWCISIDKQAEQSDNLELNM